MNNINFDNPWLLFLLIPLFALISVPFFITVRKENRNWHNIVSCVLHLVMCTSIVLALSGMTYEKVITRTEVFVVADVSYSTEQNLDKVDGYVANIGKSLPKNSDMGIVAFGRNYTLLTDLGEKAKSVKTAIEGKDPVIDRSATDISAALRYAGNRFDEDVIKRIVIITDGYETVAANDTIKVINALKNDGVKIDAVYLNDNIAEGVHEVQIDGVEAAKFTYLNKKEKVSVLVRSNNASRTQGYISLIRNGEPLVSRQAESFDKGLNVVTFDLDTSAVGDYGYTVRIEVVGENNDVTAQNNVYYFSQSVTEDIRVLFIAGTERDVIAGRQIYGTDANYVTDKSKIPLTVEELCKYDEIVLSNFDLSQWNASPAFLDCLHTAVGEFGKTLTTFGNTYVQETFKEEEPNEALTRLGDMLPVDVGNKEMDDRIIALLIDVSTSVGFNNKLSAAQEAAIALLNVFGENDYVMIVGFSGDRITYSEPTKLRNRKAIADMIRTTTVRNGTFLDDAMLEASRKIAESGKHNRELIIISDGIMKTRSGANDVDRINRCKRYATAMSGTGSAEVTGNVVVSAIGLYPSAYEGAFLRDLVQNENANGKGYYKSIQSEKDIDYAIQSIAEDTAEVKMEGRDFAVTVRRKDAEVLGGIESVEAVRGYWCSRAKLSATVVLTVPYNRDNVTMVDMPLYAYWTYGSSGGKVVSILTDIASDWTKYWSSGTHGKELLGNVKLATLPDECVKTPLIIRPELNGTDVDITVRTASVYADAELTVTLVSPDGNSVSKPLAFDNENYRAKFEAEGLGTYRVFIRYRYGLRSEFDDAFDESETNVKYDYVYEDDTTFSVAYYPEYDAFASYSIGNLYKFVTGATISEDGYVKMNIEDSDHTTFTYDFTVPLMIVAVVLIVADIAIRKLRWKDIVTFFRPKQKTEAKKEAQ